MRLYSFGFRSVLLLVSVLVTVSAVAQKKEKTYKSLLWEITGNGLKKPSYLFGTMHISNKMVFNLSDSFYSAIRNSDVVAIELNPETWQSEIPRVNKQSEAFRYYNATYYTDYLTESSFKEGSFVEQLQESLRFEPAVNDQLLYRNDSGIDNFQEDTYLDLYIYQTGKKLGKKATGVETFIGAQRMMIEAYVDMANDKDKKTTRDDDVRYNDLGQLMQDAYRRGDLDMLDSINKLTEYSQNFTEKFLYQRNDIQAHSMDSIMKTQSLFVGVGAAHLPGERGVIEILRKKGYILRPIYMQNRDATQKRYIDSLKVPVTFTTQYAVDSFYKVAVPGKLNDLESRTLSLKHYADMANGSYYLINRIRTNNLFNGYSESKTLNMIDSLLYENIPGNIVSKKTIQKNGYDGWDIVNITKKNEIQHYQILVTPAEIIIFKMGGIGSYVNGKEADEFFNSISLKEKPKQNNWQVYQPLSGGFSLKMPVEPQVYYAYRGSDNLPEWKYESVNPLTGEHYSVFKKSIYSFNFIEADTFDLSLIEESFCSSADFDKKLSSKIIYRDGKPLLQMNLRAKDGDYVQAQAVLHGPQYYLIAVRSKAKDIDASAFFNSFKFAPYQYPTAENYVDSNFNFSVSTPIKPALDADVADMMAYVKKNETLIKSKAAYVPRAENNFANFISEETGEVIVVNAYKYPEYFNIKDSAKFWSSEFFQDSTLITQRKTKIDKGQGSTAWLIEFADTASSRVIKRMMVMRGNTIITANTMVDTTLPESSFVKTFYNSLNVHGVAPAPNIFSSKLDRFLKDYNNKDTAISNRAKSALSSVYFGKDGFEPIVKEMGKLKATDKDYIQLKNKFILELGFINDSSVADKVALALEKIYNDVADTAMFQNNVLLSLARLQTPKATEMFKKLLLQDPPVFEERYEYNSLFRPFQDSLQHAARLYPELLTLTMIEDFKTPVTDLLAMLVDSNKIDATVYEDYVGNIYFDAKFALKKLQRANENSFTKTDDEETEDAYRSATMNDGVGEELNKFITLLMPYYDKNPQLPKFFDKLLQSSNQQVKLATAIALLKTKRPVADSIWASVALKEEYRNTLYEALKAQKREQLFPAKYRTNEMLATSLLYEEANKKIDSLQLIEKKEIVHRGQKGWVYFFKYKMKKKDNWKIAFSAILTTANKGMESSDELTSLTNKTLNSRTPEREQVAEQWKKRMISQRESGKQFYANDNNNVEH